MEERHVILMEVDTWKRPSSPPEITLPLPKQQKVQLQRRQRQRLPQLEETQLCDEAIAMIREFINIDSVNIDGSSLTVAQVAAAASNDAVILNGSTAPAEFLRLLRLPPKLVTASVLVHKFHARKLGISPAVVAACGVAAIACFDSNLLVLLSQTLSALFHQVISDRIPRKEINHNSNCSIAPQIEFISNATAAIHRALNSDAGSAGVASAMDALRLAVVAIGKLMFVQFSVLVSQTSISGLPANLYLSPNSSPVCGFNGAKLAMSAYCTELDYLSDPVQTADKQLQHSDISVGIVSSKQAAEAVKIVYLMSATYMVALCQAVDLRSLGSNIQAVIAEFVETAATVTLFRRCPACRPSIEKDLMEVVMDVPVFSYIGREGPGPLLLQIRQVLTEHALRSVTLTGESGDAAAFIGSIPAFESRLKQLMDKEAEDGWQRFACGELCVANRMEMCPIYRFVRTGVGTEILSENGVRSPGEDIERVYIAIVERKTLLQALLSY